MAVLEGEAFSRGVMAVSCSGAGQVIIGFWLSLRYAMCLVEGGL